MTRHPCIAAAALLLLAACEGVVGPSDLARSEPARVAVVATPADAVRADAAPALDASIDAGAALDDGADTSAARDTDDDAGPDTDTDADVVVAPAAARARGSLLAWGRLPEGDAAFSLWLTPDGEGYRVDEAYGVYLVAGGGLWLLELDREEVPATLDCGLELEGEPTGPGTAQLATALLRRIDRDQVRSLVAPEVTEVEEAELDQRLHVEASVGPYLFLRRETYSYACGAHGDVSQEALVLDTRTGAPLALDALVPVASPAALEARAAAAFAASPGAEDLWLDGGLRRTLATPTFAGGSVSVRHQLTADTCYACSDGAWSSYTASVGVSEPGAPAPLAGELEGTEAALRWLATHYDWLRIQGVSRVDESLHAAFESQVIEGC